MWIVRRLAYTVVSLLVVSILVFGATQILPGDAANAILGNQATPKALAQMRAQLGLDQPITAQYLSWITGALHGDFGTSLTLNEPVSQVLAEKVRNSGVLLLLTVIVIVPVSVLLGVYTAVKRDKLFDTATLSVLMVVSALPEFVLGIFLVVIFSTGLMHLFPATALLAADQNPLSTPNALVLPVAVLVLVSVPYLTRLIRASMIEVLDSDYVQNARLKGISERRILFRHALPNALVPPVQALAETLAYLVGGVVVVEYLFAYPGLGTALTDAVSGRDLPMVQASTLLLATVYMVVNLLADVATVYLTPKLRTATS
ncbi:ABC transporter permease [Nocardioides sp. GY 10127]|nr:ABC transporter permease [Nocardioides sp. GY 10127]